MEITVTRLNLSPTKALLCLWSVFGSLHDDTPFFGLGSWKGKTTYGFFNICFWAILKQMALDGSPSEDKQACSINRDLTTLGPIALAFSPVLRRLV